MELTESDRDEFSVAVFYGDHVHSYIMRWVSPREAVVTAEFLAKTNGNMFDKIIITDGATTPCSTGSMARASPG